MEEKDIQAMINKIVADKLPAAVADALAAGQQAEEAEAQPDAAEVEEEAAEEQVESEVEPEAAQEAIRRIAALERQARLAECATLLNRKLEAAQFIKEVAGIIRDVFAGREFQEAELDRFVKQMKEAQKALDPTGQVNGAGQKPVITVGPNEQDTYQAEFMRLVMGNTEFRRLEAIDDDIVRERTPEAYHAWAKNGRQLGTYRRVSELVYDLLGGDYFSDERAMEAATTSSMSSIVKNAMNVMLAANYARRHRWWEPLVTTEEVDTIDQATLVRVYGMSTLSVVDEGNPYTELSWADEEETAAFVKKGNYVGVTMETLLSDKVQVIRTIPQRLATSWYNTLSALVSGVFTVNTATGPALVDTGALFNATAVATATGHANLLTTALSFAAYSAARIAMRKQTDQPLGAGEKLLIEPRYLLVPTDLETTALQIRNSEQIPGSANNDINPFYQGFEVVTVPGWTDTNNWALVGDPVEYPAIWLIFLRGNRAPQLFTADAENAGAMFTNDTLRYKVRMLTWRFSSTYDCAPVSDFRPLHKSNVA